MKKNTSNFISSMAIVLSIMAIMVSAFSIMYTKISITAISDSVNQVNESDTSNKDTDNNSSNKETEWKRADDIFVTLKDGKVTVNDSGEYKWISATMMEIKFDNGKTWTANEQDVEIRND